MLVLQDHNLGVLMAGNVDHKIIIKQASCYIKPLEVVLVEQINYFDLRQLIAW